MDLSGTIVPMATPTNRRSGEIDEKAIERFTHALIEGGVHGLFPGSSIGEFSSLTSEQNRTVIETVSTAAAGSVPVFAGCGGTSIDDVIENIDAASKAGADVAVVVAPYYLNTTQRGLETFFLTIANRASLPVVLYNIPALTGNELEVQTVETLAKHENIVGLKDTSGDLTYHYRLNDRTDKFAIFQGATDLAAASLELGSDGIIAGPANVFPDHLSRLYDAHEADEYDVVTQLMKYVVAPMVSATNDLPTAAGIKHLVTLHMTDVGEPLPPLPKLTQREQDELERTYERVIDTIESTHF
jgi:4-hydroxy-tetrahydrodipicolinate synthase